MKILIINPNSDAEMSALISKTAQQYSLGNIEVDCMPTPGAPKYIENYEDKVQSAPGMMQLMKENEAKYDAFINACHCDPNMEMMRELTNKPVIGIGEASMKIASMLGHKFTVISDTLHSVPNKEALVHQFHLTGYLASVITPADEVCDLEDKEKYIATAKLAIERDGAEVIVLGCAGLAGLDKPIQEALGVPVLDGIVCAMIIASGLANYGTGISKALRYNPM